MTVYGYGFVKQIGVGDVARVAKAPLAERIFKHVENGPAFTTLVQQYTTDQHSKRELENVRRWLVQASADQHVPVVSAVGPRYYDDNRGNFAISSDVSQSAMLLLEAHAAFARLCSQTKRGLHSVIALTDQETKGFPHLLKRMRNSQSKFQRLANSENPRIQVRLLTKIDSVLWGIANERGRYFEPDQARVTELIRQRRRYYERITGCAATSDRVREQATLDAREQAIVAYFMRCLFPDALHIVTGPEVLARFMYGIVHDLPLLILKHPLHWRNNV